MSHSKHVSVEFEIDMSTVLSTGVLCPKCEKCISKECVRIAHECCVKHWLHVECMNGCGESSQNYCPVSASRGNGKVHGVAQLGWHVAEVTAPTIPGTSITKASQAPTLEKVKVPDRASPKSKEPTNAQPTTTDNIPSTSQSNAAEKQKNLGGSCRKRKRNSNSDDDGESLHKSDEDGGLDDDSDDSSANGSFSAKGDFCGKCNHVYTSRQNKFKHLRKPTCGTLPPPPICSECGKTFTERYNFLSPLAHERAIHGDNSSGKGKAAHRGKGKKK